MSIKAYLELKNEIAECERIINLSKKEEDPNFVSVRTKITSVDIRVYTVNRTNAYHEEQRSNVLNRYLAIAANDMRDELISKARQLMDNDLRISALSAQEEAVNILQQIGQDK